MVNKRIYITFDMDWANDQVIQYCYNLIKQNNIKITMNVTNMTSCIENMLDDKNIELGIHPNFNNLLLGEKDVKSEKIIENLMKLIPDAQTVRSHSLIQGTTIARQFLNANLRYELNSYIPPVRGTSLKPYYFLNKLLKIPFIYEDDLYLLEKEKYSIEYFLGESFNMERVFNFHPIHIYLNTEKIERYEACKFNYHFFENLKPLRNSSKVNGTEVFLEELIKKAKESGYQFCCINEMADSLLLNDIKM